MDTLTRAWLGKRYTFKGSTKAVDHDCWDSWPLSDDQLAYAAADVCAVIDVLHAIDSSDSLRSAQPSQHEKFKLPGPIVSGDFEDASK
jgi:ribonuclease D